MDSSLVVETAKGNGRVGIFWNDENKGKRTTYKIGERDYANWLVISPYLQ